MTKKEAVAYLRKRVMLDELFERELPETRKGAVEELDGLTKLTEDRRPKKEFDK